MIENKDKKKDKKTVKKLMIGGTALVKLGSTRKTDDVDYLINDESTTEMFIHDKENNVDYINANGHDFHAEIWKMEKDNIGEIASPQALLELKAFAFVQHCMNGFWFKADEAEFDMKFLLRKFDLNNVTIVKKYLGKGELTEVERVVNSVKRQASSDG